MGSMVIPNQPAMRLKRWIAIGLPAIALGTLIWSSDKISYDGERTIYTVACQDGRWEGSHCTGRLKPAERYRFRASKSRQEVLYWTVGASTPAGKYTDCIVKDRGNWSCKNTSDRPEAITHEMVGGVPADNNGPNPRFYAVPKWKWWLLRAGIYLSEADY